MRSPPCCATEHRSRTLSLTAKLAWLAAAGALGTLSRYGVSALLDRHAQGAFSWGTFAVNMSGCFLFGLVFAAAEQRGAVAEDARMIALTGFMGAYTTYSTFAFHSTHFIEKSQWGLAAMNIVSHNVLGIACVFAGMWLGKVP